MHSHFPTAAAALNPASMSEPVVLLNGVWATQMFRRPGLAERVIERLVGGSARLLEICRSLDADALETSPADVVEVAREAMPIAMGHEGGATTGGPYSFASKFLHWTTRRHFPIVDSRARGAISVLQRRHGLRPLIPKATGDLPWPEDYPRWIAFYSDLIRSLAPGARKRLLDVDRDSQPEQDRQENSLLRVLDKVFYAGAEQASRDLSQST